MRWRPGSDTAAAAPGVTQGCFSKLSQPIRWSSVWGLDASAMPGCTCHFQCHPGPPCCAPASAHPAPTCHAALCHRWRKTLCSCLPATCSERCTRSRRAGGAGVGGGMGLPSWPLNAAEALDVPLCSWSEERRWLARILPPRAHPLPRRPADAARAAPAVNAVPAVVPALQSHDQESFDLDEEEPNLEPAWPHLQVGAAPSGPGHRAGSTVALPAQRPWLRVALGCTAPLSAQRTWLPSAGP